MKISKRQLRRMIRGEKSRFRRLREQGEEIAVLDAVAAPAPMSENAVPEQEMIVEMELAQNALQQVVESVQAAAGLCPECGPEVAVQAPIVEAMVAQAEALQEMLEAQTEIVAESAGMDIGGGDALAVGLAPA